MEKLKGLLSGIGVGMIPFLLGMAAHIYNDAGRWIATQRTLGYQCGRWDYVKIYFNMHTGSILLSLAVFTAWEAGAFDTVDLFGGALIGKLPHNFLFHLTLGWFADSAVKAVLFRLKMLFPSRRTARVTRRGRIREWECDKREQKREREQEQERNID